MAGKGLVSIESTRAKMDKIVPEKVHLVKETVK